MSSRVLAASFAFAGIGACASAQDAPRNGVDDVRAACDLRVTWTNTGSDTCVNCIAAAPSPACECEAFKEFGGLCNSQNEARLAEPSCTSTVKACTFACPKDDCGCLEGCYATAEACKRVAAATDGCVSDVCAPYCR